MSDTFKLTYFKGNGRAALIRAILTYAKANWENICLDHPKWAELKATGFAEFGQLPILEHNDKKLSQSAAIYMYLAKYYKIYGQNIDEEYQINSLLCTIEDIGPSFYALFFLKDEEKKNIDKYKQVLKDKIQQYFKVFEARYAKLGNGKYFLGDHFSLADIFLAVQMNCFLVLFKDEDIVSPVAPNIKKLMDNVKENEMKEFFEKYFI